jgi:hypothetical protein
MSGVAAIVETGTMAFIHIALLLTAVLAFSRTDTFQRVIKTVQALEAKLAWWLVRF